MNNILYATYIVSAVEKHGPFIRHADSLLLIVEDINL